MDRPVAVPSSEGEVACRISLRTANSSPLAREGVILATIGHSLLIVPRRSYATWRTARAGELGHAPGLMTAICVRREKAALHVQFERRTEVSAKVTKRASSDPTPRKPGNSGGGKGPQFKTDAERGEGHGDWETYQLHMMFRSCRWRRTRKTA